MGKEGERSASHVRRAVVATSSRERHDKTVSFPMWWLEGKTDGATSAQQGEIVEEEETEGRGRENLSFCRKL